MRKLSNLTDTKSLLAKLLAAENISVQHTSTPIPYFDLETRTLVCPVWKDMSGSLYDLIMGHEVGHALYTPHDGWHTNVSKKGQEFKSILNCVEDARIERKIKSKFPGIRQSFLEAYNDLYYKRDFFGTAKIQDLRVLNLIDRLNLNAKIGSSLMIKFSPEEQVFADRMARLETFDEVIALADDLMQYMKQHEQQQMMTMQDLKDELKNQQRQKQKKQEDKNKPQKSEEQDASESDESGEEGESDSDNQSQSGKQQKQGKPDSKKSEKGEKAEGGEKSADKKNEKGEKGQDSDEESEGSNGSDGESESDEEGDSEGSGASDEDGDETDGEGESSGDADEGEETTGGGKAQQGTQGANGMGKDRAKNGDSGQTPQSLTDQSFRSNEKKLVDQSAMPYIYLELPTANLKQIVIENDLVVKTGERSVRDWIRNSASNTTYESMSANLAKIILEKNKNYLSHLVKEFEMRKNATQYKRQLQSKTGDLDTRNLAKYRFTNDIFRKITSTEKGKDHGLIMYVDMSSSMDEMFGPTIEHLLVLATFCKKVGIPFEVYGFHDGGVGCYGASMTSKQFKAPSNKPSFDFGTNGHQAAFHLKKLLTSDLNNVQYRHAFNLLSVVSYAYTMTAHRSGYNYGRPSNIHQKFRDFSKLYGSPSYNGIAGFTTCGTPLNQTIAASYTITKAFKSRTHVDIVNVIFLTDGDGGGAFNPIQLPNGVYGNCKYAFIDPQTKVTSKTVYSHGYGGDSVQVALTQLIRAATNCRHIGYYIAEKRALTGRAGVAARDMHEKDKSRPVQVIQDALVKSLDENNFFVAPVVGYDSYYYAAMTQVKDDSTFGTDQVFTPKQLQREFMNHQASKKANRALVSMFAKELAEHL